MQTKTYEVDQGLNFGKWDDPTSELMYYTSTKEILSRIPAIPSSGVADYGGANGNLKEFIPYAITIDHDPLKDPDILDDIITHQKEYRLVIIRFVMHYLNDYQIIEMLKNIKAERILIIQFVNENLRLKYQNSVDEHKYFRTPEQMKALLPVGYLEFYSNTYRVEKEFYKNRFGSDDSFEPHYETIKAYYRA